MTEEHLNVEERHEQRRRQKRAARRFLHAIAEDTDRPTTHGTSAFS